MADNETPKINHAINVTVRFDWDMLKQIDQIALFEKEKRAILLRRLIDDKVKVYEMNPAFKRFLKLLQTVKVDPRMKTTVQRKKHVDKIEEFE